MRRSSPLLLGLFAVASLAVAFAPGPSAEAPPETVATTTASGHTLVIEYIDVRGAYRRAKVSVISERGARTPWSGRLRALHLDGLRALPARDRERFAREGFRQTTRFLSSGHTTGSNILAPAPENLKRVWFRGERGPDASVRIPTRNHNPSTEGDDPAPEPDKPEEPAPDDPGEGGGDDGGDEEGCTGAADCVGLFNPWTCECEPDIVDPWGRGPSSDGPTTRVSF